MISSTSNQQIKSIQLLIEKPKYRREMGLYIAEGVKMFMEAPDDMIYRVYVSEHFMSNSPCAKRVTKFPYEIVADSIFKKISDTKTPQGVLTILKIPAYDIEELKNRKGCFLILNAIQDPGNLGTMIRTGEGAGVRAVILDEGCVDVYNPKVIRSTMGSIYRVPIVRTDNLKSVIRELKDVGVRMLAAHLSGEQYYDAESYKGSVGIMIGNEGNGLSDEISELSDVKVKIPMEGKVESLNAAVSAALLMYEARRHATL